LRVVGCGAEGVFDVGRHRNTEEDDGAKALSYEGLQMGYQFVDTTAVLIGEGRYEGFFIVSI
jgi:hypothetical protein